MSLPRRMFGPTFRAKRLMAGMALAATVLGVGCSAETEPATQLSTTASDFAATLQAKVSWQNGERGYYRWELSESPTFSSGVQQSSRRDFGPMSSGGGPITLAERVNSSSCTGVNGNCSVISGLKPATRYYLRFCGELSAPASTGYRCFDSNSDADPPYEYDSFVTPDRDTPLGPGVSGRLYELRGRTVTPGSYDVRLTKGSRSNY